MAINVYKLIEIGETVELDLTVSKGRRWDFVIECHQFVRVVKLNSQTLVVKEVVVFHTVSETLYHQSSTTISAIRQEKICGVSGLRGVNDIALAVSFILPPFPSPYLHYPMSKYKEVHLHPIRQSHIPFSSLLTSRGAHIVPWGFLSLAVPFLVNAHIFRSVYSSYFIQDTR